MPEILISSEAKFSTGRMPPNGRGLPTVRCTLLSDRHLRVEGPGRSSLHDLTHAEDLTRHSEVHFSLTTQHGRPETLHILLCDEMHAYIDWLFELTDLLPDIIVEEEVQSIDELTPLAERVAGQKYRLGAARTFNHIPVLLISCPGDPAKSYLITKTMRKHYDQAAGFSGDKIKGAYGKIHAAMPMRDDRLLAIKEFRYDREAGKTTPVKPHDMMREMNVMKTCKCRLETYDVLEIGRKAYCVIDYMDGTLEQFVRWAEDARLSADDRKSIGRFILQELALDVRQCHRAGHVHRDIKPENLLVAQNRVVLADYGFAERDHGGHTVLAGSPKYWDAWSLQHLQATRALDVYNMGLTWLYYMLGEHLLVVVGQPGRLTFRRSDSIAFAQPPEQRAFTNRYLKCHTQKRPPKGIVGQPEWNQQAVKDTYAAALVFEYFHEQVYTSGRLNRTRLGRTLRFWEPVEARLVEARDRDPELFQFVWEHMLVQDPTGRATADEVHRKVAALTRNALSKRVFNRVLDRPDARSRREGLRRALLAAKPAFSHLAQGGQ